MIENTDKPLREIEKDLAALANIKNKTEEQKTELYKNCLMFTEGFFLWKRYRSNTPEFEEITTYVAEELYFIAMKDYGIRSWFAYLKRCYKGFLQDWNKLCNMECKKDIPLCLDPDRALRYTPFDAYTFIDTQDTYDMLKSLYKELNQYIRTCKRFSSKIATMNAHMSIQLSLKYKKFISFRLKGKDEAICRLLFNKYRLCFSKILSTRASSILSNDQYMNIMLGEIFEMNGISSEED